MSEAAHNAAMRSAERTARVLRDLFAALGSLDHPNTGIRRAYANARRALEGNLTNPIAVAEALAELKARLRDISRELTRQAEEAGLEQAARNLAVYDMAAPAAVNVAPQAQAAWMQTTDAQLDGIEALSLMGDADEGLILGGSDRVGLLAPGLATREGSRWLAWASNTAASTATRDTLRRERAEGQFLRQAFAAIDRRTTQTCILVHGQIVGLEEPFVLEGTPRYADEMMGPPFHDYCRTSVALVRRDDVADLVTERALGEREAGIEAYNERQREEAARPRTRPQPPRPAPPPVGETTPSQLLHSWERGSRSRRSVTMKEAARQEFGLSGMVYNPRGHVLSDREIAQVQRTLREVYRDTQDALKELGITEVSLYRGLKGEVRVPGVIEAWTSDQEIARRFDGYDILRETIPASRVLAWHEGPNWTNRRFQYQREWIVLSEAP